MTRILAIAEQRDGTLRRISNEVVTAARRVADGVNAEVDAVVVGPPDMKGDLAGLGRFGADRVLHAAHEELRSYTAEGYAAAVADVLRGGDYFAALFPATAIGKDLAPRVAARLDVPLASEATELDVDGGELVVTRPVYAGKAFARVTLDAAPRLVSVRANSFRPQEQPRAGAVERTEPAVQPADWKVKVREVKAAEATLVDVAEAAVVVSGGRGMRGPENWHLLEQLRDALGSQCALGASRAVVDAGWRPHGEQVGQTGKTVAPRLYFAVGISGAIQHLAGMRTARTVVAINKDPDAPIFKLADYGIVGDAFEVLPRLAEEIRRTGE
jgi:electron transfer flavoprotein alpha subunit